MKPLGQAWGGRGQAQVGGRGSGRGGEVGPPAPPPRPPRPQRARLWGSRGGWRAIWGSQGWRSDLGPLFWAREIGRGFVAGARGPERDQSGRRERGFALRLAASPALALRTRRSASCCSSHPGPPPRSLARSLELLC